MRVTWWSDGDNNNLLIGGRNWIKKKNFYKIFQVCGNNNLLIEGAHWKYVNGLLSSCKYHLRFWKVKLELKLTFNMVSESILTRLLSLSDHLLSGLYRTTCYRVFIGPPLHSSWVVSAWGDMLDIIRRLEMRHFKNLTLHADFVRLS